MKQNVTVIALSVIIINTAALSAGDTVTHGRYPMGYFNRGPLPEKTAYLTFDDGPGEWTEGVLDVLKKENIKATFFVSAYWNNKRRIGNPSFRKYRKILIRMKNEGHIIGNHTADHKILTNLSPDEIRREVSMNQKLLEDAMGKEAPVMTIIRPPLGYPWYKRSSAGTRAMVGRVLAEKGIVALWTRETDSSDSWNWVRGEWYRKSKKVDETTPEFTAKMHRIYERAAERAYGQGMVILMHDTHNTTLKALPAVITALKARGYRFATMEDFVLWRYGKSSGALIKKNKIHS